MTEPRASLPVGLLDVLAKELEPVGVIIETTKEQEQKREETQRDDAAASSSEPPAEDGVMRILQVTGDRLRGVFAANWFGTSEGEQERADPVSADNLKDPEAASTATASWAAAFNPRPVSAAASSANLPSPRPPGPSQLVSASTAAAGARVLMGARRNIKGVQAAVGDALAQVDGALGISDGVAAADQGLGLSERLNNFSQTLAASDEPLLPKDLPAHEPSWNTTMIFQPTAGVASAGLHDVLSERSRRTEDTSTESLGSKGTMWGEFNKYLYDFLTASLPPPRELMSTLDPGALCFFDVEKYPGVKGFVCLTIDDAPCKSRRPEDCMLPEIQELLREHDAKATFFLCSDYVPGHEEHLVDLLRDGHEVANHCAADRPYGGDSEEDFEATFLQSEYICETLRCRAAGGDLQLAVEPWKRDAAGDASEQVREELPSASAVQEPKPLPSDGTGQASETFHDAVSEASDQGDEAGQVQDEPRQVQQKDVKRQDDSEKQFVNKGPEHVREDPGQVQQTGVKSQGEEPEELFTVKQPGQDREDTRRDIGNKESDQVSEQSRHDVAVEESGRRLPFAPPDRAGFKVIASAAGELESIQPQQRMRDLLLQKEDASLRPRWFRAPHVDASEDMHRVLKRHGFTNVLCDSFGNDTAIEDPVFIADTVLKLMNPEGGSIVVIHTPERGFREHNFQALRLFLEGIKDLGLRAVNLTQLDARARGTADDLLSAQIQ